MKPVSTSRSMVWVLGLFMCQMAGAQVTSSGLALSAQTMAAPHWQWRADTIPPGSTVQERAQALDLVHWSAATGAATGFSLGAQTTPWGRWAGDQALGPAARWQPRVGVHWRQPMGGRLRLGVSGWMQWSGNFRNAAQAVQAQHSAALPVYAARLEVQWKSARGGGIIPEFGAIGVQLQGGGDARLLLRARHGGPMVYYRAKF
ncbi:hypothetical protein [Comamonas flocculans]|uniref:DUF3575 domain-containing protein n=1 Tax=Comamonas flocculans TaxID=2597701 RepID=A0A5B8RQ50_9BURK|nr:hypothetical protein [Comamonas flocculans]QEA11656.1 hypothetical protein FOZ74_00530 [Comamonas flocculans]